MAKARDTQNMGTKVSLSSVTTPYNLQYRGAYRNAGIERGSPADWFGPLNPLPPTAPPDVKGRILDYASGYNLNVQPRAYESISFDMLRAFADSYDLMRTVIETRKDQLARQSWGINVRKQFKSKKSDFADKIYEIEQFFLRPDKENFWDTWLRMILEDLLVLDAPSLYVRRNYGGEIYSLEPIDGGTIKRVIDDWGRTPVAPLPAYQQVLKGFPAVDYTTEELIYKPRNLRTNKVYGYSPVEQIVMTVNIALRRQTWQLQSFTEGNIPEALIGTPATWTPDQINAFQQQFDSMLEGNTGERRRARFVPGEIAKGYVPTKTGELFGEAEEWLARVVCFAFSISPQPFIQMMNRATAETAQETAVSDGLAPLMNWVKGLMDSIIIDLWQLPELEFSWGDEDELDPKTKSEILGRDVDGGQLTFNESRLARGLDPYPDEDANRPMMKTAAGYVPIFLTPEEKAAKEEMAAQIAGAKPEEEGEEGEGADSGDSGSPTPPASGDTSPPPGDAVKGAGLDDKDPFSSVDLAKASEKSGLLIANKITPERPYVAKREKKIKTLLAGILARTGKDVSKQIVEQLKAKGLAKAEEPGFLDEFLDDILTGLKFDLFLTVQDELEEYLQEVNSDSGRLAVTSLGTRGGELVEQVNERSVKWAREHAADLVGANPDSPYSITDATREMLRTTIADGLDNNLSALDIAAEIQDAYAFSEERAERIAFTEITSANSLGALAGYEEAKDIGVNAKKSWLVLEDGCVVCQNNADAGKIELDKPFPSGDMAPGAHPSCRCVLIPEFDDEAEKLTNIDEMLKFIWDNYRVEHGVSKLDNHDEMAAVFPVELDKRSLIWAMGGNSPEATAERESSLLQFVPFECCVATQDYCDLDKVKLYIEDPTAKGFAPMAHQIGDVFYIQDGHHRAVASKSRGLAGIEMNVRRIDETPSS